MLMCVLLFRTCGGRLIVIAAREYAFMQCWRLGFCRPNRRDRRTIWNEVGRFSLKISEPAKWGEARVCTDGLVSAVTWRPTPLVKQTARLA